MTDALPIDYIPKAIAEIGMNDRYFRKRYTGVGVALLPQ